MTDSLKGSVGNFIAVHKLTTKAGRCSLKKITEVPPRMRGQLARFAHPARTMDNWACRSVPNPHERTSSRNDKSIERKTLKGGNIVKCRMVRCPQNVTIPPISKR